MTLVIAHILTIGAAVLQGAIVPREPAVLRQNEASSAGSVASPPTPSRPTPSSPIPDGPSDAQRIAQAARLGSLLYTFDRAAWVSSDALTAAIPKSELRGADGYVVEQPDPRTLHVTYYRGAGAAAQAFFVADVRGGKVVSQEVLVRAAALTPAQALLVRAREVATQAVVARGSKPCTPLPFNSVVLPPQKDGLIAVYLLSAQKEAATFPMGGHYCVLVDRDGKVSTSRPYTLGCLPMTAPKLPPSATPVGFVVNHLLDPVPTEIHVFASYSLHMPVFVATPDKRVWRVKGSEITPSSAK
ncbi:hypothetical protein U1707_11855 [Sphingomonas sp. PB2P12]|uniref:hypothetical protein n=1 Tax=Sphingomonas sandaracina TaxID=3096157 RepID=UPI002FC7312C